MAVADNHSKSQRSYNMSRIRGTNTAPEERVRKYLFSKGFRYRKNVRKLPGCPDIVLPKYKTVIFVNGCFWHKHSCKRFVRHRTKNTGVIKSMEMYYGMKRIARCLKPMDGM